MSLGLCIFLNKRAAAGSASVFMGVLHHNCRWNCTESKVKDADKSLPQTWQSFMALLEEQEVLPDPVKSKR